MSVVAHPPQPARRQAPRLATWWGRGWARAVEEAAYAERDLRLARALARGGHVGGISVGPGRMVAAVVDTGRGGAVAGDDIVTVDVRWTPLDPDGQAAVAEVLAAESGHVPALLRGELPAVVAEHLEETGAELLPSGADLDATCTCVGWLDPCPHALAVVMQVGWLVDADPLVLLHLRGLPRAVLLARIEAVLGVDREPAPPAPTAPGAPGAPATDPGSDPDLVDATLDLALDAALRAAALLRATKLGDDTHHLW